MGRMSTEANLCNYGKAFGARWFILMSGPPTVPLAVLAFYVENPIAKFCLALTAIACAVFASYWIWRIERTKVIELEEKNRPKLRLSYKKDIVGCVVETTLSKSAMVFRDCGMQHVITESSKVKYIRIAVDTDGINAIQGCSGIITLITKNSVPVMSGENLPLPFAPANQPDALSKTIRDKVTEYLDAVCLNDNNEVTIPSTYYPNSVNFSTLFAEPALYEFLIIVSGHNTVSNSIQLKLNWTGNWQTAEAYVAR